MNGPVIVHGGQTGVDRGAFLGARDAGLRIAGYAPYCERDEAGPIPADVRASLWRCAVDGKDGGYRARTGANVELADAVVLVVQDIERPEATRGTGLTLDVARKRDRPIFIAGLDTTRNDLLKWIALVQGELPPHKEVMLMVAGPRASLWRTGEACARTMVSWLGEQRTAWPLDNNHPIGGGGLG